MYVNNVYKVQKSSRVLSFWVSFLKAQSNFWVVYLDIFLTDLEMWQISSKIYSTKRQIPLSWALPLIIWNQAEWKSSIWYLRTRVIKKKIYMMKTKTCRTIFAYYLCGIRSAVKNNISFSPASVNVPAKIIKTSSSSLFCA